MRIFIPVLGRRNNGVSQEKKSFTIELLTRFQNKDQKKTKEKEKFPIKDRKKTKEKEKFPIEDWKKINEIYRKIFGPDNI